MKTKKTKKQELEKQLQKIRKHLGRVIVCKVGVTDAGNVDILEIETLVPFSNEKEKIKLSNQIKPEPKSYIG
jgi:hypothetical protein